MPTPLTDGAIVQVVLRSNMNQQVMLNVLHYKFSKVGGANDYVVVMQDLGTELAKAGSLCEKFSQAVHSTTNLLQLDLQPVFPQRLTAFTKPIGLIGTQLGVAAPQNVSAVIEKLSDIAARFGRGSFHLGGLAAQNFANGVLNDAFKTNSLTPLAVEINKERDLANGGSCLAVLWNKSNANRATPMNGFKVMPEVRTMRRRTIGVGI